MAHLPVQCQNCGARYKIPETFKSDSAKCKGCGSMIDVKAVRGATADSDDDAKPAAKPTPPATGGTRKPRQTVSAGGSKRRRGGDDDDHDGDGDKVKSARGSKRRGRRGHDDDDGEKVKVAAAPHALKRHGRRGHHHDDEEGEEGERHHYEKKKDNTPMIAGIVIGAMAIVAVVFWLVFPWDEALETNTAKKDDKKVEAKKADDGNKEDSAVDPETEAKAAAAVAKKAEDDKKAKEAAAKKKKDAAAKKKAIEAAAKKGITDPKDVFKPSSVLKKLDRPASITEDEEKEINGLLDDLRTGSGLAAIRAPGKLEAIGWKILPLVTNRLLELDYSKHEDSEYAYLLANRVILPLGRWEFGFRQSKQADSFDLKDGHENALRVENVHTNTRLFWSTPEGWEKYKTRYKEKFNTP